MAKIHFVLLDKVPLADLATLDVDRDWREFVTGERAWILQTYLRLRAAGLDVELNARLPDSGIAVFSSKQRRALRAASGGPTDATLIGVREDVGAALFADYEVVQNRHQADGQRSFFIPFWPQPGLIPRDGTRGTTIANIGFKGFRGNLHADLVRKSWQDVLARLGSRWLPDAVDYFGPGTPGDALDWNDYRVLDLIVALRPDDRDGHPRKPATKLYNAWLAGVPALLGPEIAYRELRRSELDYIEIANADEARAAIAQLKETPALYAAMVRNGAQRAVEFNVAQTTRAWSTLLTEVIPARDAASGSATFNWWRRQPLATKEATRRVANLTRLWRS
jgi:hypothetical protein